MSPVQCLWPCRLLRHLLPDALQNAPELLFLIYEVKSIHTILQLFRAHDLFRWEVALFIDLQFELLEGGDIVLQEGWFHREPRLRCHLLDAYILHPTLSL